MFGNTNNSKLKENYPPLSPLGNMLKRSPTTTFKLRGNDTNQISNSECPEFRERFLPVASDNLDADSQIEKYSLHHIMNQEYSEGVQNTIDLQSQNSSLKAEVQQLKQANSNWKSLNNEMMSVTLSNFMTPRK